MNGVLNFRSLCTILQVMRMKNYLTDQRALFLHEVKTTPTPTPKPTVSGFSDVRNPKHAYYNAIYWAADAGITKGYSDGTFGINRNVSSGECMGLPEKDNDGLYIWQAEGEIRLQ